MFLLNIAAYDALLIKSGMLFHKRLPRNVMESMPNVMLFAAGIRSRSLVLTSYLTFFLIKHSCIKGGLILLSVLYISIISIRRLWVWTFVSPFFASNASNVDSWSKCGSNVDSNVVEASKIVRIHKLHTYWDSC